MAHTSKRWFRLIGAAAACGLLMGPALAQEDDGASGYSPPSYSEPPPDNSSSGGWFTTPHNEPPPEPPPAESGAGSGYPPLGQAVQQCQAQLQELMRQCSAMAEAACRILEEQRNSCP